MVILGKEPYLDQSFNDGLAFSVPKRQVREFSALPMKLQNILGECHEDTGTPLPNKGDLTKWARQGVLLLNTTLTSRQRMMGTHNNIGWDYLVRDVLETAWLFNPNTIFVLWGFAREYREVLPDGALVLEAADPSPIACETKHFIGCKHFSQINSLLKETNQKPISWRL